MAHPTPKGLEITAIHKRCGQKVPGWIDYAQFKPMAIVFKINMIGGHFCGAARLIQSPISEWEIDERVLALFVLGANHSNP